MDMDAEKTFAKKFLEAIETIVAFGDRSSGSEGEEKAADPPSSETTNQGDENNPL